MKNQEKPAIFSLEWFKSKIKRKPIVQATKIDTSKPFKFKSVKFINDNLIVVTEYGNIYTKPNATKENYDAVINCKTVSEFTFIMHPKESESTIKNAEVIKANNGFELLKQLKDFTVTDTNVTLKETNRTIPTLLVNKFIEIINFENEQALCLADLESRLKNSSKYQAHRNFFLWCCLNPRAEVADSLYAFLEKNSFNITKQGFIVALRNVITVSESSEIIKTISSVYHKVKTMWRKRPIKYFLFQHNTTKEYSISLKKKLSDKLTLLGNLQELYTHLSEMKENRYTDAHTGTFDIRIGKVVSMLKEDCNWNTQDCSGHAGLHFTNKEIHYVGCGDQSVLMLINPMKIVGIGSTKGRCYEYLPIMAVNREEASTILEHLDFDTLEIEENYAIQELKNLKEEVRNGFVAEVNKHEFNIPKITTKEVSSIIDSLNKMKSEIEKRIIKLK